MQIVDTNVVSDLLRPRPNAGVLQWAIKTRQLAVSAISVDESIYGLVRGGNRALLEAYEELLRTRCIVLPVTEEIACRAGNCVATFHSRALRVPNPTC